MSALQIPPGPVVAVLVFLTLVAPSSAQDPTGFEARAEYLLRRMDSGLLPTPMLVAMLDDPFAQTRVLAVRVVASSGDPGQTPLLGQYVGDRDYHVRYEVMVAAGRLGAEGKDLALRGLGDPIPKVRQAAAWAACHGGEEALAPLLEAMKKEKDVGVRATAIANLWRFDEAGWEPHATAVATSADPQLRRAAAYSLSRSPRQAARAGLRSLAGDDEAVIRATAVAGLRRAALAEEDFRVVARALADPDSRIRAAACWVLAEQPQPALSDTAAPVVAAMWSAVEPHTAIMALRAAAVRPEIGTDAELLELVSTEEPWLASEAYIALVGRGADGIDEIARVWVSSDDLWRRRTVARVAPTLGQKYEKAASEDAAAAVRLAWVESLEPDEASSRLEMLKSLLAEDSDPFVRTAALNHLGDAKAVGAFTDLLDLARSWAPDAAPDARAAALTHALAVASNDEQRTRVLKQATNDPNPAVGILVINAARSADLPARSTERELRHDRRWYVELVDWMRGKHWLDVTTDRGGFRIRLDSFGAPISTREIFDLAAAGFYDDLVFHRVVPNFVVQGGDPRGDGWGGPGFILPDEPGFRPFDTWRVGVATSGPNTGGSQLFITLMPADHLVGHYTNLGEVVAGREVVARLRVGDRIRGIEAFSGDEPSPPAQVLLGPIEWDQLADVPGWQAEYDEAKPGAPSIGRLASATGSYRIVTVLGSWCHDSQREVPRLIKVLDQLETPAFSREMIGVDRTRRIDDPEVAWFAGIERTVDRVATMVVFDSDGMELGRVVETAEKPIEELLVEFIAPMEGW